MLGWSLWTASLPAHLSWPGKVSCLRADDWIWVWVKSLGTPKFWMVNTKLDFHICGPTSVFHFDPHPHTETSSWHTVHLQTCKIQSYVYKLRTQSFQIVVVSLAWNLNEHLIARTSCTVGWNWCWLLRIAGNPKLITVALPGLSIVKHSYCMMVDYIHELYDIISYKLN